MRLLVGRESTRDERTGLLGQPELRGSSQGGHQSAKVRRGRAGGDDEGASLAGSHDAGSASEHDDHEAARPGR